MIVLAILFALAAAVWLIPIVHRSRVTAIALVVLLTGTVLGPAFYSIDGPIRLSLDRLLWAGMFVVLAVRWRMGQLSMAGPSRVDWMLIILAGWLLGSALRGGEVTDGHPPLARWLFYIAMPIGMYAVSRCVEVTERDIQWLLAFLTGLGVYLGLTAVFEAGGMHALVYPKFILNEETWQFLGRGRGPLLNPAGNGIVLSISLTAALLRYFQADQGKKLLYLIAALIIACGIAATLTRSVWIGAGLAGGMIAMVNAPRTVRVLGLAVVVVFGGAMALGVKDQLIRLKRDRYLTAEDAAKSIELRPLLAVVAWEMFKDHPVAGHGFGQYREHSGPYHEIRSYGLPLEQARRYYQHNVVLSILVDSGLVGLTLLTTILGSLAGIGWQLARGRGVGKQQRAIGILLLGTLAAYLCNGMFHDVSVIPMVHMFLFYIAGLAVSCYCTAFASPHVSLTPEPRSQSVAATAG